MNEQVEHLKRTLGAEYDSVSYCCEIAESFPIEQIPELIEEVFK